MPPAKPHHAAQRDDAPSTLSDDDEWVEVAATGDYVGAFAEDVSWSDVVVRGGRWSGASIEGFQATDVRFENCDLAGFVVTGEVSLRRVEFVDCRMTEAVLAGAHLRDVRFASCVLTDANLRMVDATDVAFQDCNLVGADLYRAKVSKSTLSGCDLRGIEVSKATFTEVDLRTSRLEDVKGADCEGPPSTRAKPSPSPAASPSPSGSPSSTPTDPYRTGPVSARFPCARRTGSRSVPNWSCQRTFPVRSQDQFETERGC